MMDALFGPDDLAHIRIARRLRGYDPGEIDELLDRLQARYSTVVLERDQLRERIVHEIEESRAHAAHVSDALISAERIADQIRAEARQEADALVAEAVEEASQIRTRAEEDAKATLAHANAERDRVTTELERLRIVETEMHAGYRAFLLSALQLLDDAQANGNQEPSGTATVTQAAAELLSGRAPSHDGNRTRP